MLARFTILNGTYSCPSPRVSSKRMADDGQRLDERPEVHETGACFGVVGVCCEFIPFTARL